MSNLTTPDWSCPDPFAEMATSERPGCAAATHQWHHTVLNLWSMHRCIRPDRNKSSWMRLHVNIWIFGIYIYIDRDYILYRLYMQNSTINVFWYRNATSYQSPNTCVNMKSMKFSKNILASSKSLPWSLFTWLPYLLRLAWGIQTLLNGSPFPTFSICFESGTIGT